jgi:hypothetical protein
MLAVRRDHLGDAALSVPFLGRLLESGAEVRVLLTDGASRALLSRVGVRCVAELEELGDWKPDGILFLESCRHLRSQRHPERWSFVESVLSAFPGAACAIPSMRRAEAMSVFPGSYCTPLSGVTALSLLERFADGLGLPRERSPLLERWVADDAVRSSGCAVLNLSAGRGESGDRRAIPISFWAEVAEALAGVVPLACIVQPGDDALRRDFEDLQRSGRLRDCPLFCFDDIADAAQWLGRQRVLASPETGLCHLARNLRLPMVVLTPRRQVPYWYPPGDDVRFVFAERLRDASPRHTAAAVRELL